MLFGLMCLSAAALLSTAIGVLPIKFNDWPFNNITTSGLIMWVVLSVAILVSFTQSYFDMKVTFSMFPLVCLSSAALVPTVISIIFDREPMPFNRATKIGLTLYIILSLIIIACFLLSLFGVVNA